MLIFKLMSHLATTLVAFVLGTGIVGGVRYLMSPTMTPTEDEVSAGRLNANEPKPSGVYFVAPSIGNSSGCSEQTGELYPFGWDSYLQTHQMPQMRRTARDGRWFFFETQTSEGRSFEFFGIIPDSAGVTSDNKKVAIWASS
jgi:hypothetical protein